MTTGQMLALRPYQLEGVAAVEAAWARGLRRPAVVWPTGAGKTVGFARLAVNWLEANPGGRAVGIAHTGELLDQMTDKFRSVAPGLRVGRVQAHWNETLARLVCASVQTLSRGNRRDMLRNVGLLIIDECHHAPARTYLDVLTHFGALGEAANAPIGTPGTAVAVGFTATMERGDELALGQVWQDVVHSMSIADAIAAGWLVRPRGIHVQVDDLDLSAVRSSGGDYRAEDLGDALMRSMAPEAIVKAVAEHAADRRIIAFAPTVASAALIADALRDAGHAVGLVHGGMPAGERKAVLDDFRAGRTKIMLNCMILTEGFDDPSADCALIARPTRSPVLYKQIAGRVIRPYPGKTDALLLDVVGVTRHHSLVSGISLFGDDTDRSPRKLTEKDQLLLGDEDPDELAPGQMDARRALLGDWNGGPLVADEVDLFAASPMQWHRTRAGVFYIEAGERYIAIVPGAMGGYDVTAMHRTQRHTGRWIVQAVPDLPYAMAWAEGEVSAAERTTATKKRSWRAAPPSQKMQALAARLGVHVDPGARSGEVSAAISLVLASSRIDPHLPAWMKGN